MHQDDETTVVEETGSRAYHWQNYMQTKKAKLQHQVNVLDKPNIISNIFEGVSIFVNGYTNPPAAELRKLIRLHGGEFHIYYKHGTTTYTLATHLATGKAKKLRKEEKIIHPRWLTDSIGAGIRLCEDDYLLYKNGVFQTAVAKRFAADNQNTSKGARNAANDPNFVRNFYERSRLHLISTLAQEMKCYVDELRENQANDFPSRTHLLHLADHDFIDTPKETICHIDLDCFFVSVALRSRPNLIGKPIAITHSRGTEGAGMSEVASCSYEARAQGVRNGCFIRDARKLCPDLICLPYQFDDYRIVSKEIYSILSGYTLNIRAVSCDEMYVNLESLCKEMHITNVMEVISVIRSEILNKTGCNASVGVGNTMLLARVATRHAKPNGQFLIKVGDVHELIKKEKISSLPGVGYNICAKLKNAFGEMNSCEDLQKVSINSLQNLLGEKIGTQENELMEFLGKICSELEKKLDIAQMTASSITLKLLIRAPDAPLVTEKYLGCGKCEAVTRSAHLQGATANKEVLHAESKKLMKAINPIIPDLRGIGIQLTHLHKIPNVSVGVKPTHRNTLTQFFAVKSRGQQYPTSKKKSMNEEDIALQLAIKKSLEESKRNHYRKETIHPDYRNYFEDEDVKAEFLRVLERYEYPTAEVISEMATYFGLLVKNGDFIDVLSQLRFLQRETMQFSLEWITAVSALKMAVNRICDTIYGSVLFGPL
uniref:DNA repair protein REV1 n=1 Tax=Setaria digitata TaxID=48799 RepID=A0A915PWG2_9BILA